MTYKRNDNNTDTDTDTDRIGKTESIGRDRKEGKNQKWFNEVDHTGIS